MGSQREQISPRAAGIVYRLLLLVVLGWSVATMLSPIFAAYGEMFWAMATRYCFSLLCHQQPARSFYLWGSPLAVCARCSGIYAGVVLGLIIYPWMRNLRRDDLPPRGYLIVAGLPTTIDFLLGYCQILENTHLSRSITGAIVGAGLAFYLLPATICTFQDLAGAFKKRRQSQEFLYGDTK